MSTIKVIQDAVGHNLERENRNIQNCLEKKATLVGNHNGSLCMHIHMETVAGAATALTCLDVCLDKDSKAEALLCHVYRVVRSRLH